MEEEEEEEEEERKACNVGVGGFGLLTASFDSVLYFCLWSEAYKGSLKKYQLRKAPPLVTRGSLFIKRPLFAVV